MKQKKKLGVIVPYRNRPEQLKVFKDYISKYLFSKKILHELIIVEQQDDKPFNRGLLLNWGCRKAEWAECDYVVFHDIDMLPVDVDYSYSDKPLHLVQNLEIPDEEDSLFYDYFGGVTMFSLEDIKKVNGYSNDYVGWGFEDDDLFLRCLRNGIEMDFLEWGQRRHPGIGLQFNGKDSYVAINNPILRNRNFSIFGSFTIDSLDCNLEYEFDEMSIFSFPGPDIALSYRSFMNFNFQLWDKSLNPYSVYTKKYPFGSYNYCITFNMSGETKEVKFYINGNFVGSKILDSIVNFSRNNKKLLYLGTGDPDREVKPNFFKGLISNFAIYDKILDDSDIADISNNTRYSLFEFKSGENLTLYFDSKFTSNNSFIDLAGDNNNIIKNCKKVFTTEQTRKKIPVPFRRPGIFKAIPHKNSGFTDTWADWSSRTNQSKYFKVLENEFYQDKEDGLSTYWGELINEDIIENYNHLYVKS